MADNIIKTLPYQKQSIATNINSINQVFKNIYTKANYLPPELQEKHSRFYIPVFCEDIFSGVSFVTQTITQPQREDLVLTYTGNLFQVGYTEAFESPLDTKLGKALYGKTSK